ncbi:MAG: hypothetical protein ABEI99_01050 [Halobaculum sp.]
MKDPTKTHFPKWAESLFEEVGPKLVETDETLSRQDVIDLIDDATQADESYAEDVYEAWYDHGRVYEPEDGDVRVTLPEEEGFC